jgi:hypothetical protein
MSAKFWIGIAAVGLGGVASAQPVASEPKFNTASAKAFAAKVQPILANRCADCHARKDHASGFVLKRIDPGLNDPQGAEQNLRAAVKWITPAAPHDSPLLTKAIAAHGKAADPPLPSAGHVAYQVLELWVHWACAAEGSPAPAAVPPRPTAPVPTATPAVAVAEPPAVVPVGGFATAAPKPPQATPGTVNPDDPFDPAAFNRTAHPPKK